MSEYCTNLLIERIKYTKDKYLKQVIVNKRLSGAHGGHAHNWSMEEKAAGLFEANGFDDQQHSEQAAKRLLLRDHEATAKRNSYLHGRASSVNVHHMNNYDESNSSVSDEQKRYLQILNEIFEIAQIFPNVLDTYYKKLCLLFPSPSENIAYLLQKIKHSKSENSSMVFSKNELDEQEDEKHEKQSRQMGDREMAENAATLSYSTLDQLNTCRKEQLSDKKIADMIEKFENKLQIMEREDDDDYLMTNVPINIELRIDENDYRPCPKLKVSPGLCQQENRLHMIQTGNAEVSLVERNIHNSQTSSSNHERSFKLSNESRSFLANARIAEEELDNLTDLSQNNEDVGAQNNNFLSQNSFVSDLRRQMELTSHPISSTIRIQSIEVPANNRDIIENFCSKHADKIRHYMANLESILPIAITDPIYDYGCLNKTLIQNSNKTVSKSKKKIILKFACNSKTDNCLFGHHPLEITTDYPSTWIHLIFLSIQAHSPYVLRQQDSAFLELKFVYENLNEKLSFIALLTSSFPSEKDIIGLKNELGGYGIFDLFEFKSHDSSAADLNEWLCYMCANPDRAASFLTEKPIIQGELKEKHGKWKLFKRWQKRLFTLTGGSIVYYKKDMRQESLNVKYIRTIQTMKKTTRSNRNILQAFEIFTDKNSFILKPENSTEAEQWLRYLQVSKCLENNRNFNPIDENSLFVKTSL